MSNENSEQESTGNNWVVWASGVIIPSAVAAGLYFFTSLSLWWIGGITVAVLALLALGFWFFSGSEEETVA